MSPFSKNRAARISSLVLKLVPLTSKSIEQGSKIRFALLSFRSMLTFSEKIGLVLGLSYLTVLESDGSPSKSTQNYKNNDNGDYYNNEYHSFSVSCS